MPLRLEAPVSIVLREREVPGGAGSIKDVISAASTLDATVGCILRDTVLAAPGIAAPALPRG